MRLYLPRVEARLRGITALWFCRKKGHLHTIPCNEQEWDKELAYNRHFTQYINKHPSSRLHSRSDYGTKIKEDYPKCYTDPRSSRLGSTTDQLERNNTKDKIFIELLLSLVASSARTHRHLQAGFGSICESRGLSNLTPSRSRLFKLMGKVKV